MDIGGDNLSLAEVQFGLRLLSQLVAKSPGKNVIVSPLGLFQTLSLFAFQGAEAARGEMRQALGISKLSDASLHAMYRQLNTRLLVQSPDTQFLHATSLWAGRDILPDAAFAELAEQWGVTLFSGAEVTDDKMQQWAHEHTGGLLATLSVPPPSNGACLMNAVYFRGKWKSRFESENTRNKHFYRTGGFPKATPLMRQPETNAVCLYRSTNFDAARIPYASDTAHDLSLHVIVPRPNALDALTRKDAITPFIEQFTHGDWDRCQTNYRTAAVDLILPRYTFRQTHDLKQVLQKMGMRKAFEPVEAQTTPLCQ